MTLLSPGDTFPAFDLNLVGGDTLSVPDAFDGRYGVVIFNRGSWCPFCNAQLRAFERVSSDLAEINTSLVSLSVDDEPTTQELIDKHHLTFPVGHSADAHQLSDLTGAFVNPEPSYLQATGFVLDPRGKVLVSSYSSGAIGRLTADDTLGFLRYVQSQAS